MPDPTPAAADAPEAVHWLPPRVGRATVDHVPEGTVAWSTDTALVTCEVCLDHLAGMTLAEHVGG